jgi:ribosome-associated protein
VSDVEEVEVPIRDASIRLGQLLKLAGLVEDGAHARQVLDAGEVSVDDEVEVRRGRQVRPGDVVTVRSEGRRIVVSVRRR